MPRKLPQDFVDRLKMVTGKRARVVIDHLLEHGQITTDELKTVYGYNHPPRAIRDVRENGIPIEMVRITGPDGRSISAYTFGDPSSLEVHKAGGRRAFPKQFKAEMVAEYGLRCGVCNVELQGRYLQIDHRIPYEVSGESSDLSTADFMLICASCNRAKSWSCESCPNIEKKEPAICRMCYWAMPLAYHHIATQPLRRLDIVWSDSEVEDFERLRGKANQMSMSVSEYVKDRLRRTNSHPL